MRGVRPGVRLAASCSELQRVVLCSVVLCSAELRCAVVGRAAVTASYQ